MPTRPSMMNRCPADTYCGGHERICEFFDKPTQAGGLIGLTRRNDRLHVSLYRLEKCDVSISHDDKPNGGRYNELRRTDDEAEAVIVGLLNAIHDSMTHESQRHHAEAINKAHVFLYGPGVGRSKPTPTT